MTARDRVVGVQLDHRRVDPDRLEGSQDASRSRHAEHHTHPQVPELVQPATVPVRAADCGDVIGPRDGEAAELVQQRAQGSIAFDLPVDQDHVRGSEQRPDWRISAAKTRVILLTKRLAS